MDIPENKIKNLEIFFENISTSKRNWYAEYWNKHTPNTSRQRWQKWLFAAASIHTGWENNVAQYEALKDIKGNISLKDIALRIKSGGMQHRKAKLIKNICDNRAYDILPKHTQDWDLWRDYHRETLWGIGNAKISFAGELIDPLNTKIICIDRHILDAFGQDKEKAPTLDDYMLMEDIWLYLSESADIPPAISRFIYWDCFIQNKTNSKYWSSLLEN